MVLAAVVVLAVPWAAAAVAAAAQSAEASVVALGVASVLEVVLVPVLARESKKDFSRPD